MESVVGFPRDAYNYYQWAMSIGDPRTRGWFLVDSPLQTLAITGLYLAMIRTGPRLMRHRRPFNIRPLIVLYNMAMVVVNAYMVVQISLAAFRLNYSIVCQPVVVRDEAEDLRLASAVWVYFVSKIVEFLDTLFFILKKKDRHISFLHVYHHSSVFTLWWIAVKWVPGGSTFGPALINCIIHVIMYSYYTVAALGPTFQRYLWWKKYLTVLQLGQFVIVGGFAFKMLSMDCDFPKWMVVLCMAQVTVFFVLFADFYVKAYTGQLPPRQYKESID